MHLYNDNSPIPPKNQIITVMCPRTPFPTGMDVQDIGIEFFETYAYDIMNEVVQTYIEYTYQSPQSRDFVYANFLKDQFNNMSNMMEYVYSQLMESCENSTDTHPEWSERIMTYFNNDIAKICDAIHEMYSMFHIDLYHPVTDMIELCKSHGLMLAPDDMVMLPYGYSVSMSIMEEHIGHSEYDDAHTYPCSPFRMGIPAARTTAEVRLPCNGIEYRAVYPMVYTNTIVAPQYPLYVG